MYAIYIALMYGGLMESEFFYGMNPYNSPQEERNGNNCDFTTSGCEACRNPSMILESVINDKAELTFSKQLYGDFTLKLWFRITKYWP